MPGIQSFFENYGDIVEVAVGPFEEEEEKAFEPNVGGGVEREELKDSDFVFSKERKFPVVIPKDVKDAVSSWGRYKGPRSFEEFKANLTRLCRRKGEKFVAALPDSWEIGKEKAVEEETEKAEKVECPECGAEFSADEKKCPECGHEHAEGEEKKEPEVEKEDVPEEVQDEGKSLLAKIYGAIETLSKAVLGGKEDVDQVAEDVSLSEMLKALDETGSTFKTFQGADGQPWIMLWTTNAFKDRDGEIFTTKSIEEYIDRHVEDNVKGAFRFWHLPGTDFGDIRWQGMTGRFLVEMGPYRDTKVGRWFKQFFEEYPDGHPVIAPEGWGASHGYLYKTEDRRDGVYDWFEKRESSALPAHVASNPYNPGLEVLEMGLSERQIEALKAIGGDPLVHMVVETGEQRTKELEEAGVEFKEAKEPKGFAAQIMDIAEVMEDLDGKETLAAIAGQIDQEEGEQKDIGELGQALLEASENLEGEQQEDLKAISGAMMKVAGGDAEKAVEEVVEVEKAEETEPAVETEEPEVPESGLSAPDATALAAKVAEALQLDALSELLESQKAIIEEQQEQLSDLVAEIKTLKGQVDEQERDDTERLAEKEANLPRFSWFRASQAAETVLSEGVADQALKESKPEVPPIIELLAKS